MQALTGRWQAHITRHHYCCTRQTLAGLGELYRTDQRFQAYLDQWGTGTAAQMAAAIAVYCGGTGEMLPQKIIYCTLPLRRCGGGMRWERIPDGTKNPAERLGRGRTAEGDHPPLHTSNGRRESVAEHSWMMTLMAFFLQEEFPEADMNKVIRMYHP